MANRRRLAAQVAVKRRSDLRSSGLASPSATESALSLARSSPFPSFGRLLPKGAQSPERLAASQRGLAAREMASATQASTFKARSA